MTMFFNIGGIEMAFSHKGGENLLSESYRPFICEHGNADIVFEWHGEPDASLLAILNTQRPLLKMRRCSVYSHDSELVYVSPPLPLWRVARVVTISKSLDVAAVYIAPAQQGLPPLGIWVLPVLEYILAHRSGIIVHGAAVEVNGSAWLFVGPSGAGKSHWAASLEEQGARVLGDEHIVLRKTDNRIRVFGTPWNRKPHWCVPGGAPLERVFFLRQAGANTVQPARPSAGAALLLQSCFLPIYDRQALQAAVQVATDTISQARPLLLGYATETPSMERLAEW